MLQSRSARVAMTALLTAALAPGCRAPSELRAPDAEESRLIRSAVESYIARQSRDSARLTLLDLDRGEERTVQIQEIRRPKTVRSRYYLVPAIGRAEDGSRRDVVFFVLATGPVHVVDTAVIASPYRVRFGP